MSETPETDAQELVHSVSGSSLQCVRVDFARKLERERNEARAEVARLREALRANKVFVLFEGHGGSQPNILAVFQTKAKLCAVMRDEFPKAKAKNRMCPSELYWEDDDGFWFKAVLVSFFREGAK